MVSRPSRPARDSSRVSAISFSNAFLEGYDNIEYNLTNCTTNAPAFFYNRSGNTTDLINFTNCKSNNPLTYSIYVLGTVISAKFNNCDFNEDDAGYFIGGLEELTVTNTTLNGSGNRGFVIEASPNLKVFESGSLYLRSNEDIELNCNIETASASSSIVLQAAGEINLKECKINSAIIRSTDRFVQIPGVCCNDASNLSKESDEDTVISKPYFGSNSLEETLPALNMQVHPNPTKGIATLSFSKAFIDKNSAKPATVTIYNALSISIKTYNNVNINNDVMMDVQELVSGIYFVKINVGDEVYSKRLIKE